MPRSCPFCSAPVSAPRCGSCGRDPTAARRLCQACGKWTPSQETVCCGCGAPAKSSLRWKIPLIVLLFLAAFALSIVIALE